MTNYKTKQFLALAILSTVLGFNFSCKENKSVPAKKAEIIFKKEGELKLIKVQNDSILTTIDIEVADNDYERETGLMYRSAMQNHQGMLFVFDNEQYLAFYMKNTIIPLDILYINSDQKIIDIYKNTIPYSEEALPSSAIAKYVLEVNGGLTDEWQITIGDSISYSVLD